MNNYRVVEDLRKPRWQLDGDYVVSMLKDTPRNREDAKLLLRANGCRSVRHDTGAGGMLRSHGFLYEYAEIERTSE